jgi:predicted ATPase
MLEKLFLENFQGFGRESKIDLAPLTLIFGPNSSGKSSIIRSILLLQQGMRASTGESGVFVFDGDKVNLGSFENAVNGHKTTKKIRVGVELENFVSKSSGAERFWFDRIVYLIDSTGSPSEIQISGTHLSDEWDTDYFDLKFNAVKIENVEKSRKPSSKGRIQFQLNSGSRKTFEKLAKLVDEINQQETKLRGRKPVHADPVAFARQFLSSEKLEAEFDFDEFTAASQISIIGWELSELFPTIRTPELPEKFAARPGNDRFRLQFAWSQLTTVRFKHITHALDRLKNDMWAQFSSRRMFHIGPLRPIPSRLTIVSSSADDALHNPTDIPSFLASNVRARSQVSQWIRKLTNGAYVLDFLKFSSAGVQLAGNVGALVLQDTRTKTHVTFNDAGVGLSQVLPILSTLITAENTRPVVKSAVGTTILIEQPELHLHPSMQGQLMSLFVEHVASNETRQIIAETHSENMVLRLQSEMKRGRLSPESVSIIYVDRDELTGLSKATQLHLNENGDFITDWPKSFSKSRIDQISED